MNHVMIDLETLGVDPDSVFFSIGACKFDPDTGEISDDTFHRNIEWESAIKQPGSVDRKRTINPNTIKWWFQQSEEARLQAVKPGDMLIDVLNYFKLWLPKDPIVWSNGSNFDISILENAYNYDPPWHFLNIRDVRTITHLARGIVNREHVPFEGVAHNPLDDAIHQATYVSKMWQALRKAPGDPLAKFQPVQDGSKN